MSSIMHSAAIDVQSTPAVSTGKRVLFITLHFPPSRDIGAHACEQIARYFPLYGWHPVVLTRPKRLIESPDPNYRRAFPGTIIETGLLPHPLSIYKRLKSSPRPSSALRAPSPRKRGEGQQSLVVEGRVRGRGLRRWLLSLLQTPDIYTGWLVPATIAGLRAIRRERITHIFSSGPYWTNHLVALAIKTLTGLPWTAHFRDPWNQVPQEKPVSALSARVERFLERLVITRADSVVCMTETHSTALQKIFPKLHADKFVTIPNGYDEAEWEGVRGEAQGDKFVITYPGTFMMGTRSPRPLFRALRRLIDAGEITSSDLHVDLFGNCASAEGMDVAAMAAQYDLHERVHIGPPLGRPETLRRMASSNLLLLLAEGWTLQIPGKTYEYLRAGRPILALTSEGALAGLLRKTGGAHVADPADDAAIARAILDVYNAWKSGQPSTGADGSVAAAYDRRNLAKQYTALFG